MMLRPMAAAGGVLVLGTLVATIGAQSQRAMTVEDLIVAPRVADPQLSPDGRTVLFVRTETDGATGRRNTDILHVPADGTSGPAVLIGGEKSESTPRWSPDGRRIAFLSNRDGAPQIYVADSDGSNVRKVTSLHAGAQAPVVWSPDGTMIAFVSDVFPECRDEACNRQRFEAAEANPVKVRRLTRLLYRHWDAWRENIRHHVFVADVASGAARDLTPGDFDSPPAQQEGGAIAFAPDSRTIAFVSNREGNDREAWTTNNDVFLVPVTGGEARQLTKNPAADTHPVFAKDGRTLYLLAQRRAGFESDRWYLDAYELASRRASHAVHGAGPVGERVHAWTRQRHRLVHRRPGGAHASVPRAGVRRRPRACARRGRDRVRERRGRPCRVHDVVADRAPRGVSRLAIGRRCPAAHARQRGVAEAGHVLDAGEPHGAGGRRAGAGPGS